MVEPSGWIHISLLNQVRHSCPCFTLNIFHRGAPWYLLKEHFLSFTTIFTMRNLCESLWLAELQWQASQKKTSYSNWTCIYLYSTFQVLWLLRELYVCLAHPFIFGCSESHRCLASLLGLLFHTARLFLPRQFGGQSLSQGHFDMLAGDRDQYRKKNLPPELLLANYFDYWLLLSLTL